MKEESLTSGMKYNVCSIPHPSTVKHKKAPIFKTNEPTEAKHTRVLEKYPELRQVKGFYEYPNSPDSHLDKELVLKYIIIMYSIDSYHNERIPLPTLEQRMYDSAVAAGFHTNSSGSLKDDVEQRLFLLNDEFVFNAIFDYLVFQNSDVWTELVIIDHELMEYRRIRFQPVSDAKDKDLITAASTKDKLRKSCDEMVKQKQKLEEAFFGIDTKLKEKAKKKRVTLEDRAKSQ